jgi:hypothetical protein
MENIVGVKLESFQDDAGIRYAVKHQEESNLQFHGLVTCEHFRDDKLIHTQTGSNIFTTEGMARILNVMFGASARDAAIYVGIYKGSVTPAVGNTAANSLGAANGYTECQDADYTCTAGAGLKPLYSMAVTTTATGTNTASKATFTMANTLTVYGAFLSTVQSKTASTGTLFCAKNFAASRAVIAADELAITYAITITTS